MGGERPSGRWSVSRRLLSADEAEDVLARHFEPGVVEAHVLLGCYVVWWWRLDDDTPTPLDDAGAESPLSFEAAIRELARKRPDLIREPLDAPSGLLKELLAREEVELGVTA